MRSLIAVVVLLVSAPPAARAADPPGGPGWYQLDTTVSVPTAKGTLVIAAGTPGQLVSINAAGTVMSIRFERGLASWLGAEINSGTSAENAALLTVDVDPAMVKAFVKQLLSRVGAGGSTPPPRRGGAEPGALGALGGGGTTGAGFGGSRAVDINRDTTVTLSDTVRVASAPGPVPVAAPPPRAPAPSIIPPGSSSGASGGGGTMRAIGREEHDAWLKQLLAALGEDGARCETKGYGPGWVSICEPRAA